MLSFAASYGLRPAPLRCACLFSLSPPPPGTAARSLSDDGSGKSRWEVRELEKQVENEKRGVFRILDIGLPKPFNRRMGRPAKRIVVKAAPREKLMKPTQDWPSVWPAQRTFHPAVVPLPVRQGFAQLRGQPTPGKYANAELMKIPNFLHLTPPAIRRHCEKLRRFCTYLPPELLNTNVDDAAADDEMELNFPLTEITSDYLNASSSIRDLRSRIVTLKFRLCSLPLPDGRARDKFIRLVGGERYEASTDVVTVTSDRMPYRKQNREYCEYLVKVLFFESTKVEEWEAERSDEDFHRFEVVEGDDDPLPPKRMEYMQSLKRVMNEGESRQSLDAYKSSVRNLFGIKDETPVVAERM